MARSSPRPSMACSFCAPQLQDDDAMVAQELDQLVSTVLERSTKAMVATKFLGFVRQHPVHGPGTSAPAVAIFRNICRRQDPERIGVVPTSQLISSFRPCSELPGISWRLQMQNLAHFAMLTWPGPPPTPTPTPCPLKQHEADHGGSNHLTNSLRSHDPRMVSGI